MSRWNVRKSIDTRAGGGIFSTEPFAVGATDNPLRPILAVADETRPREMDALTDAFTQVPFELDGIRAFERGGVWPQDRLRRPDCRRRFIARHMITRLRDEEQCPRADHRALGVGPEHAGESLLHDVVKIRPRRKTPLQPTSQHRLVREHFSGEPCGLIGTGRIHGETNAVASCRTQVRLREVCGRGGACRAAAQLSGSPRLSARVTRD